MIEDMPGPQRTLWVQCLFVFALVWSVGGNTDAAGRTTFNKHLRAVVADAVPDELAIFATGKAVKLNQMCPDTRSVYDFVFDKAKSKWEFWLSTVEAKPLDPAAEYSEIVVPTVDTVRCVPMYLGLVSSRKCTPNQGPTAADPAGTRSSSISWCCTSAARSLWGPRARASPST